MRVIAYAYDADIHCKDCTLEYLAQAYTCGVVDDVAADFDDYKDSEGNDIHPVFDTDEWYANDVYEGRTVAILACGDCEQVIEELDLED